MRRTPAFLIVSVSVFASLLTGCASSGRALSPATLREREAQVVREDERWSKVAAERNPAKVASFYSDDAVVYPPNMPVVHGRAAAEKTWAGLFELPASAISWNTQHSGVSESGEIGYTSGAYVLSFNGPDGRKVEDRGKYLCVWKRQSDGSWKSIHDMWNSDLPMP